MDQKTYEFGRKVARMADITVRSCVKQLAEPSTYAIALKAGLIYGTKKGSFAKGVQGSVSTIAAICMANAAFNIYNNRNNL